MEGITAFVLEPLGIVLSSGSLLSPVLRFRRWEFFCNICLCSTLVRVHVVRWSPHIRIVELYHFSSCFGLTYSSTLSLGFVLSYGIITKGTL